jgi:cell wall-associated NlpC family hydrolase
VQATTGFAAVAANDNRDRGRTPPIHDHDIPAHFWSVPYDFACFPAHDLSQGANCQAFAYALLRHFGHAISDFRSSVLWDDTRETVRVIGPLGPLDLLLFNPTADPYGAHVGVYLGEGRVIHLAKRVGRPAVWPLERFARERGYEILIGAKRVMSAAPKSS